MFSGGQKGSLCAITEVNYFLNRGNIIVATDKAQKCELQLDNVFGDQEKRDRYIRLQDLTFITRFDF